MYISVSNAVWMIDSLSSFKIYVTKLIHFRHSRSMWLQSRARCLEWSGLHPTVICSIATFLYDPPKWRISSHILKSIDCSIALSSAQPPEQLLVILFLLWKHSSPFSLLIATLSLSRSNIFHKKRSHKTSTGKSELEMLFCHSYSSPLLSSFNSLICHSYKSSLRTKQFFFFKRGERWKKRKMVFQKKEKKEKNTRLNDKAAQGSRQSNLVNEAIPAVIHATLWCQPGPRVSQAQTDGTHRSLKLGHVAGFCPPTRPVIRTNTGKIFSRCIFALYPPGISTERSSTC